MKDVKFFKTQSDFRKWLEKNHLKVSEQWVGFYKKGSGKPSIDWPQSVDEALCFGWIDGLRKSIDEISYKIRFTPRKPKSHWSNVNIKRIKELMELGLVFPAGEKAFSLRDENRTARAAYEQKSIEFNPEHLKIFKSNKKAWEFFCGEPAGYRKTCTWWVISAKREETRLKRLEELISDSAAGLRLKGLRPGDKWR
jgi:uncharacterized protein YdeI (YjbR/CyaY-like superfamily)